MRKELLLSLGVGATLVLAVFVGAAAATTGAPVFYDARYPAQVPASTGPGGYDVSEGVAGEPGSSGPVDEADTDGAPVPMPPGSTPDPAPPTTPSPPPSTEPTPPATIPPTDAPETEAPTPTPTPTPTPDPDPESSPLPDADDSAADRFAPGAPTPGAPAPTEPPTAEQQQVWLAFQQIVRECMAGGGQEYLYWEWWNPGPDDSNRFPAMPADLSAEQVAAWEFALHGDAAEGDAYRWEDAGCWGYAVHVTGGTN